MRRELHKRWLCREKCGKVIVPQEMWQGDCVAGNVARWLRRGKCGKMIVLQEMWQILDPGATNRNIVPKMASFFKFFWCEKTILGKKRIGKYIVPKIDKIFGHYLCVCTRKLRIRKLYTRKLCIRNWVPENCILENCALENCALENCALENCAPENCAPENCASENCVPENCVPENCILENCASEIAYQKIVHQKIVSRNHKPTNTLILRKELFCNSMYICLEKWYNNCNCHHMEKLFL